MTGAHAEAWRGRNSGIYDILSFARLTFRYPRRPAGDLPKSQMAGLFHPSASTAGVARRMVSSSTASNV